MLKGLLLSFVMIFAVCVPTKAQTTKPLTRIEFVFDASFSMFGQWQSGMKMDIAKKMLTDFLDSIKGVNNLEIALRCYGHQVPLRPERSCTDTKLEVPFKPSLSGNILAIKNRLKTIVPKGTTPIAYTLEQCGGDFPSPSNPNVRNIIILITDGIEECDGDPCAVSLALQKKGIVLKPFVIGIGLDQSYLNSFGCIGKFYDASNESSFKNILNIVISQALNNTTVQVNLNDQIGRPTETDVDMTFYDEQSGIIRYNYMHTINEKGNPDTILLDPLYKYKMVVHTIPPVIKDNISVTAGKHTIIGVDAAQGELLVRIDGVTNYDNLKFIVRPSNQNKTLHVQNANSKEKYLVGKYDLEVLTLPRMFFKDAAIDQNMVTTIQIPQPGKLNINYPIQNFYADIYQVIRGELIWVHKLPVDVQKHNIIIQPGDYKLIYRGKGATRSNNTFIREFKISSGQATNITLN